MKRRFFSISVIFIVISLIGCSQNKPSTTAQVTESTVSDRLANGNVTLTVMLSEHPTYLINTQLPSYKRISEITGVNVEYIIVPSSDYTLKTQTMISTNNMPDILKTNTTIMKQFVDQDVFLPLNSYIQKYGKYFPEVIKRVPDIRKLSIEDEMYGFPATSRDEVIKIPLLIMRTDLLDKHNLREPVTYEELFETLKKLKGFYPNKIGYCLRGTNSFNGNILYSLGTANNIYFDPDINNGSYVFGPAREEYRDAMIYLNRMYREGILDPEYAVTTQQQWSEKFGKGDAMFLYDNPTFVAPMSSTLAKIDPTARLDMIGFPRNSRGQQRALLYTSHNFGTVYVINADIKEDIVAYRFMDWFYSDEACDLRSFGILGEHFYIEPNGVRKFYPQVLEEKQKGGEFYGNMQTDLGIAINHFTPYLDNTLLKITTSPELAKWWFEDVASFSGRQEPTIDPPFTLREIDRINEIRTAMSTLLAENVDKFVTGSKPIGEWEQFASQLKSLGAAELEQIYNNANNRIK